MTYVASSKLVVGPSPVIMIMTKDVVRLGKLKQLNLFISINFAHRA